MNFQGLHFSSEDEDEDASIESYQSSEEDNFQKIGGSSIENKNNKSRDFMRTIFELCHESVNRNLNIENTNENKYIFHYIYCLCSYQEKNTTKRTENILKYLYFVYKSEDNNSDSILKKILTMNIKNIQSGGINTNDDIQKVFKNLSQYLVNFQDKVGHFHSQTNNPLLDEESKNPNLEGEIEITYKLLNKIHDALIKFTSLIEKNEADLNKDESLTTNNDLYTLVNKLYKFRFCEDNEQYQDSKKNLLSYMEDKNVNKNIQKKIKDIIHLTDDEENVKNVKDEISRIVKMSEIVKMNELELENFFSDILKIELKKQVDQIAKVNVVSTSVNINAKLPIYNIEEMINHDALKEFNEKSMVYYIILKKYQEVQYDKKIVDLDLDFLKFKQIYEKYKNDSYHDIMSKIYNKKTTYDIFPEEKKIRQSIRNIVHYYNE